MPSTSIITLIRNCKKATLLKDLIWPAVAGNVAWTFFSVLLTLIEMEEKPKPYIIARIIAILLLSCYLGIVYLMSCEDTKGVSEQKKNYFDIAHSLSIIICAIAFQLKFTETFCNICLTVFWAIAAFGHWTGAWIPHTVSKNKCWKQVGMGCISVAGIFICWVVPFPKNWNLVASLFAGLVFWGCVRHKLYAPDIGDVSTGDAQAPTESITEPHPQHNNADIYCCFH